MGSIPGMSNLKGILRNWTGLRHQLVKERQVSRPPPHDDPGDKVIYNFGCGEPIQERGIRQFKRQGESFRDRNTFRSRGHTPSVPSQVDRFLIQKIVIFPNPQVRPKCVKLCC